VLRTRARGQSIVEFGIIAILFTLIMFAIADFGLLLNDWLSVSSGARLLARDAAVGMTWDNLQGEAGNLNVPGVAADPPFLNKCCSAADPDALQLNITYCAWDVGNPTACGTIPAGSLDDQYVSNGMRGTCPHNPASPCAHPAAPTVGNPGDSVQVTLTAAGARVLTPLVRPFFGCAASTGPCYVPLSSTVTMRFEGDTL
jgi:hypothetical protein